LTHGYLDYGRYLDEELEGDFRPVPDDSVGGTVRHNPHVVEDVGHGDDDQACEVHDDDMVEHTVHTARNDG